MASPADLSNNPIILADDVRFKVREMLTEFDQRRQDVLKALANASATDRASAGDCADLVVMAKRLIETIDDRRKAIAQPYRDAVAVIPPLIEQWSGELIEAIDRVARMARAFHDAEQARISAQQEQQRREQAELLAQKAAPLPEPPVETAKARPIRGAYGAKISSTTDLVITVENVRVVPLEILNSPKVHSAIIAVARDFAKHQKTIAGLGIRVGEKNEIRRN